MLYIIYILAISLQVSGALLLILFSASTKRDEIIRRFVGKELMSRDGDDGELTYDEQAYREEFKVAFLNKISFVYIASGYLFGVWGEIENASKLLSTFFIAIVTMTIMSISIFGITFYIKKSKNVGRKITNDDLKRLNLEPTITSISEKDIAEMWDECPSENEKNSASQ